MTGLERFKIELDIKETYEDTVPLEDGDTFFNSKEDKINESICLYCSS